MAENVGTITVAIEAQTAELQAGLEQAERAVKESAQQMEASQEQLGDRVEQSWTEFASKLGVVMQVAQIAQQAITALGEAAVIMGDKSTSAMEKYNSVLDSIQNSGIPVLSQAVSIGSTLRSWIDGSAADLARLNEQIERMNGLLDEASKKLEGALSAHALKDMADRWESMTEIQQKSSGTMFDKLEARAMEFANAREDLEKTLQEKIKKAVRESDRELARESMARILSEFDKQTKFKMEQIKKLADAKEAADEAAHQKELARVQKEAKAKEEAAAREARAIENTTQGLRDTLAQLTARSAGDELGAQMIALEAKFRKMREGATSEQLALIAQIEAKEKEALTKRGLDAVDPTTGKVVEGVAVDDGAEDGGGRGATTSVSTAIGSFTVAMAKAGDPIQKKQTSLLERIATSNAKIADIQEKEKAVKEDVPTKETKIVEATKEKETKTKETEIVEATKDKEKESAAVVEKALTGMQKIMEDTQATIKDLTRQVLALGATEGQSDETKAKRAGLREDIAEQFKYKEFLQREANIEADRMKMLAASEQAVPAVPTPQEVVGGVVERDEGQIEQTTLLQKIADSNEKVADALSKRSSEAIIVPT